MPSPVASSLEDAAERNEDLSPSNSGFDNDDNDDESTPPRSPQLRGMLPAEDAAVWRGDSKEVTPVGSPSSTTDGADMSANDSMLDTSIDIALPRAAGTSSTSHLADAISASSAKRTFRYDG